MSYDQYQQQPQQYGSPAPSSQGYYGPPQGQYGQQQGYGDPQQQHYPPQSGYGSQQPGNYNNDPYNQQQGGQGSYGPPAQGGFQHGQSAGYYGDQGQQYGQQSQSYPGQAPANQYPQQGPYSQQPAYDANQNSAYPPAGQNYGSTDPAAQQDGERGLMGALAGGAAGYYGGSKKGHGFLGSIAGAFAGSKLEDKFKGKKHHGKRELE